MTPNEIEILIHYHTTLSVHPRIDAQAVIGAIERLLKQGLIIRMHGQEYYTTTLRGKAHIQQLCNLTIPIHVW